jgi:putative ATPase
MMQGLGYSNGYLYAHDFADGVAPMSCLPASLADRRYYVPTDRGAEHGLAERLERLRKLAQGVRAGSDGAAPPQRAP